MSAVVRPVRDELEDLLLARRQIALSSTISVVAADTAGEPERSAHATEQADEPKLRRSILNGRQSVSSRVEVSRASECFARTPTRPQCEARGVLGERRGDLELLDRGGIFAARQQRHGRRFGLRRVRERPSARIHSQRFDTDVVLGPGSQRTDEGKDRKARDRRGEARFGGSQRTLGVAGQPLGLGRGPAQHDLPGRVALFEPRPAAITPSASRPSPMSASATAKAL